MANDRVRLSRAAFDLQRIGWCARRADDASRVAKAPRPFTLLVRRASAALSTLEFLGDRLRQRLVRKCFSQLFGDQLTRQLE